jgi:Calcineurin-like phosphoesterase
MRSKLGVRPHNCPDPLSRSHYSVRMGNVVKILTATDLHRGKRFYDELTQAVAAHKPNVVALVGDFLDALETIPEQYSTPEAANVLSKLFCQEIIFVRGNHEDFDFWNFADAWAKTGRKLTALHGELFLHGPLAMVGFPCGLGDETAYLGCREPLPESPDKWLSKLVKSYGPVMEFTSVQGIKPNSDGTLRFNLAYRDFETGKTNPFPFMLRLGDSGWKVVVEGEPPDELSQN